MSALLDFLWNLFDTADFPARWHCGNWTDLHGWLHIISDTAVGLAYLAIPVTLLSFVRSRRDVPFPRVFWLFAAFIVACGSTHLIEALIFWVPVYRVSGLAKLATAGVSWATVLVLVPTVREALQLKTPAALEAEVEARTAELKQEKERSAYLAAIVNSSDDAIVGRNLDGRVTSWNDAAARLYGYAAEEAFGEDVATLMPDQEEVEAYRAQLAELLGQGRVRAREVRRQTRGGEVIEVSLTLSPVYDGAGELIGVSGISRDITESKRRYQQEVSAAREDVRVFERIIADMPIDVAILARAGQDVEEPLRFTYLNRDGGVAVDAGAEEVLGRTIEEVALDLAQTPLQTICHETLRRGGSQRVHQAHMPDGRIFDLRTVPISDTKLAVIGDDITERVQSDEATLRGVIAELERSNADLEQFAYIASHDLREPLRMVSNYVQLLEEDYGPQLDDEARVYIHYAVDGAERMQQLLEDLLTYSRVHAAPPEPTPVEASRAMRDALVSLERVIDESDAEISCEPLPRVLCDKTQLAQVFQNLIGNAIKFSKPGQTPDIAITTERDGRWRRIHVADQGIGFDETFTEEIFTIFRRLNLREDYDGSGVGLAICKRIAERYGGRLSATSAPGEGATFTLELEGVEEEG